MTDARSLIMGSGSPAFSFNYPNDTVTGQILTEPKAVQARDFATGQPAFWPSGDPKMQTVFQIQTGLRNYEGINSPDRMRPDDGVRTLYVKGKWMEKSTKEAILAAGAQWLDIGGWVSYTYTGDDMSSKAGNKPKLFAVRYQPPAQVSQPVQHHGGQGQPGYAGQRQQSYAGGPAQPAPVPAWQQAGWNPQQGVQGVPAGLAGPGMHAPAPVAPWPPAAPHASPAVPSHHGSPEQMPQWAQAATPSSAVPAPTSAPPAPALSTLELIAQAQQATVGASDWSDPGQVQPVF